MRRSARCPEPSSWSCWYVSIWHLRCSSWSCRKTAWNARRVSGTRSAVTTPGRWKTARTTWRSIRRSVECTCPLPWETCSLWRVRCFIFIILRINYAFYKSQFQICMRYLRSFEILQSELSRLMKSGNREKQRLIRIW